MALRAITGHRGTRATFPSDATLLHENALLSDPLLVFGASILDALLR
jgi:hypothetical protein